MFSLKTYLPLDMVLHALILQNQIWKDYGPF